MLLLREPSSCKFSLGAKGQVDVFLAFGSGHHWIGANTDAELYLDKFASSPHTIDEDVTNRSLQPLSTIKRKWQGAWK